jgi:hypothetical protein
MANQTGKGCFKSGQSGNPGGRPAVSAELRALARERTPEAMKVLTDIMMDPKAPAAARVAACRELFDRGYGRAESSVHARIETSEAKPDFSVLNDEERDIWRQGSAMLAPLIPKVFHQDSEGETAPLDEALN